MKLWIDGTTPEDTFYGYEKGYSDKPPFAVFDEDAQDNRYIFISRWLIIVRFVKWWHGGGWSCP